MTRSELLILHNDIEESNVDMVLDETGGVPLFVQSFIEKKMDMFEYEQEVIESICHSLRKLKDESGCWDDIVASTISFLLCLDSKKGRFDKRFLIPHRQSGRLRFKPLVPQVLEGYRSFVWCELMAYVGAQERMLLAVCRDTATTNRVRDCHFETMVIRRCACNNVDIAVGDKIVTVPSGERDAIGFYGKLLPESPVDGLSFPFDPNFPAIDFFLKGGRFVFAFQVHVSGHDDVSKSFIGLCRKAGWFQLFDCIQLIYLSPDNETANQVLSWVTPPTLDAVLTKKKKKGRRFIGMSNYEKVNDKGFF
jgi:hypothetical protein